MSNKQCSVDGCSSVIKSRGMCGKHYKAWMKENYPGYRDRIRNSDRKRRADPNKRKQERERAKDLRRNKHVYFDGGAQEKVQGDYIEIKINLHTLSERTGYIGSMLFGYIDNLVSDGLIKSYEYDNKTLVITMLIHKSIELAFSSNLNAKPEGVQSLTYGNDRWLRNGKSENVSEEDDDYKKILPS